jgi:hypothetical protein
METELNQIERLDTRTSGQEQRRAELMLWIEELKDFERNWRASKPTVSLARS